MSTFGVVPYSTTPVAVLSVVHATLSVRASAAAAVNPEIFGSDVTFTVKLCVTLANPSDALTLIVAEPVWPDTGVKVSVPVEFGLA
jgi:hypothetical protein